MRTSRVVWSCLVLSAALVRPAGTCSPSIEPLYWFTEFPGATPEQVLAGQPGLISGEWPLPTLLVVYRHLEGLPMARWAQIATPASSAPATAEPRAAAVDAAEAWSAAVKRAGGETAYIYREREIQSSDGSSSGFYVNCLDDAFRTAARTLDERVTRYGAGSRETKAWLAWISCRLGSVW